MHARVIGSVPSSPRSWVDLLLGAVRALSWPLALVCACAVAGLMGVLLLARAATGNLPSTGTDYLYLCVEVTYPVVFVATLHVLDGVAERAVATARPALDLDADSVAALVADLTRTPAVGANVAVVLGVSAAIASIQSGPAAYHLYPDTPAPIWIETTVLASLVTIAAFVFALHAIHQLRLVHRVTRDHAVIDLYHLQPLYAFATLTAWTAMALIGTTGYGIATQALFASDAGLQLSSVDLSALASIGVVAIASFVAPLLGLHGRIVAVKAVELARATSTLHAAIDHVHDSLAAPGDHDLTQARNGMDAANIAVGAVRAIPTWPWRQETFRAFVSALALPIVVWIVQAVLARIIPR